ncbi:MAG: hypothetical protein JWO31_2249 [Phycisphaerales bacterium]|nr:hypothetical protein [Phycisphaerales bacterium]
MPEDALRLPAAVRPSLLRRLRFTPLRDLARGRVSGRLDVAHRLAAIDLPAPAADVVRRVVRRTKLWRAERVAVADELIAHFADGLAAGEPAEALVAAFGDERQAARLIRRAKIRNRPLAWHALRWLGRGVAVLVVAYIALVARYFRGRPTVSTDYVAKLNAPIERVPASDRAWPLYQQAIGQLALARSAYPPGPDGEAAHRAYEQWLGTAFDARPGTPEWPDLTGWLDQHAAAVELIRQAAARPDLGFVLGSSGSQRESPYDRGDDPNEPRPLVTVLMPYLSHVRTMADAVAADLRVARDRRDGGRVVRDLDALLGMADQTRSPFVINQLVGNGTDRRALYGLDEVLAATPDVLDDTRLVRVAHRLSALGGGKPLLDLAGERMFFYDLIQRSFTDDGRGDGRLTPAGIQLMATLEGTVGGRPDGPWSLATAAALPVALVASRREQVAEYDRLMDLSAAQFRRPAREADWSEVLARVVEIKTSSLDRVRYLPIAIMIPVLYHVQATVERLLGQRDGLVTAIALELYRRRHGAYPPTLDALVPDLLPAVPVDRVAGGPIRYKLMNGKPVLYSVGIDGDDDGGRMATNDAGNRLNYLAAEWRSLRPNATPVPDGDWLLFPESEPDRVGPAAAGK